MAITNITSNSDAKEWVLACNAFEQCEIESLKGNVNFVQTSETPPFVNEQSNMYFLENIPRDFTGNGIDSLYVFIDKNNILRKRPPSKATHIAGVDEVHGALRVIAGYGDLMHDAYGHQKVVQDTSLFSSSFTFNVDRKLWIPYQDGVEIYYDIGLTRILSTNGKLVINSGANINEKSFLKSRRHPRYQPNKGHLYSSSIFLPNKNAIGIRNYGLFDNFNGAFFSLEDGVLYAVVRTTIDGVTSEPFKQAIDFNALRLSSIDLEKGNIFDIQMQWRGVGNIKWFIGDPSIGVSVEIAEYSHMNTSAELSISNPSIPVSYECINTNGTEVTIQSGCIDVSTENGTKGNRSYASATTGELATTLLETPMIVLRVPQQFDGKPNTRDIVLTSIDAFCDVNAQVRVYYFRDPTAILATFLPIREGFQEAAINGSILAFDTTKMIKLFETRIPAQVPLQFTNPDKGNGDLYLINGDYILVTIQGKNNSIGGVTLEYAEEI